MPVGWCSRLCFLVLLGEANAWRAHRDHDNPPNSLIDASAGAAMSFPVGKLALGGHLLASNVPRQRFGDANGLSFAALSLDGVGRRSPRSVRVSRWPLLVGPLSATPPGVDGGGGDIDSDPSGEGDAAPAGKSKVAKQATGEGEVAKSDEGAKAPHEMEAPSVAKKGTRRATPQGVETTEGDENTAGSSPSEGETAGLLSDTGELLDEDGSLAEINKDKSLSPKHLAEHWIVHDVSANGSSLLTQVHTRGELKGIQYINLPAAWVRRFEVDTVRVRKEVRPRRTAFVGRAKLSIPTKPRVFFTVREMPIANMLCELRALELLSPTGCVPGLFEAHLFKDAAFILTEGWSAMRLDAVIDEATANGRENQPQVPPVESLPVLVDLLRAMKHMEDAGIVLGDIREDKIDIEGYEGHAIIRDLRSACFPNSPDPGMRCNTVAASGSAFRQAPEMVDGVPTGASNNIWQIGLIFAKMNFGTVPTEHCAQKWFPDVDMSAYDSAVDGRDIIRKRIAADFTIQSVSAFKKMPGKYKDVMDLLAGMLEKNPENRWTAGYALERALLTAAAYEAPIPPKREPAKLPAEWFEAAE